jgi:hypothetical protein
MKAKRNMLLALLALMVLAGAGYALLTRANEQAAQSASEAEKITLSSFSADSLASISYTYDGQTIDLEKQNGIWALADDTAYHVLQTYANSMATALCQMSASRVIENVSDYGQYGLDNPEMTVTANVGGEAMSFYFGSQNKISEISYLQMEGDPNVYAVSPSIEKTFQYTKEKLYDTSWLPVSLTRSDIVRLDYSYHTADAGDTVSLTAEQEPVASSTAGSASESDSGVSYTQVWYFTGSGEEVNPAMASAMLDALFTAPTSQNTNPAALSAYGLDAPALTVRVTDSAGSEETISLGIGTDGYYLMRAGDNSVYTASQALFDTFAHTKAQLAKPKAQDSVSAESALTPSLEAAG